MDWRKSMYVAEDVVLWASRSCHMNHDVKVETGMVLKVLKKNVQSVYRYAKQKICIKNARRAKQGTFMYYIRKGQRKHCLYL